MSAKTSRVICFEIYDPCVIYDPSKTPTNEDRMTQVQEEAARRTAFLKWKRRLTPVDIAWVETYMSFGYPMDAAVDTLFYNSRHITTTNPMYDQ